eukprot:572404-Amphidinium_carterae.1
MSLQKWHNLDDSVIANSRVTMRINNGPDMQMYSRLTILHSQVTINMDGDSDYFDNDVYYVNND